jgi:quercetin dioxygenase-like cupin family protein
VSGNGWRVAQLSEIEPFPHRRPEQNAWRPIRHRLGISAFGVNAWVAEEAGEEIIEEHDEVNPSGADNHEEVYLVLDGHATFTVDGSEIDAPRGTLVFVEDPSLVRKAVASEPGTAVLAIGATPGVPFRVSPWEQRNIDA